MLPAVIMQKTHRPLFKPHAVSRKRLVKTVVVVLMIAAVMIIVTRRRPLSSIEERLVGTWDYNENGATRNRLTFFRDRTAVQVTEPNSPKSQKWNYTWYVQDELLCVRRNQAFLVVSSSGLEIPERDDEEFEFQVLSDTQIVVGQWVHDRQTMHRSQPSH